MLRHLPKFLDTTTLRDMGGQYVGRIQDVIEERINNRFKGQKGLEPIIVFGDGWRLIPNITQRKALIAMFGRETDEWVGREIVVHLHVSKGGKSEKRVSRSRTEVN